MNLLKDNIIEMMAQDCFEIKVRNAGVFRFPPAYRFEMHNHREIEIDYINSGSCIMGMGETYVPMKRGDCMIVYAGVPHKFIVESKENCRITQLEFEVRGAGKAERELRFFQKKAFYYRLEGCEISQRYMESLCRIYRDNDEGQKKEVLLLLGFFQLFVELSEKIRGLECEKQKRGKAGKISRVVSYINENWNQEINIEELAKRYEVSSRYIRKCFQQETGVSCQRYICTLRVGKAKELLWFTSKSVTEIALETGFGSTQYFCRVFQNYTEMTPLEYRNLWKGQKAQELCTEQLENASGSFAEGKFKMG
ncbi:MAG: AraC family transcriptional regulator [Lachnospiraceae bacterium]|nr:AraC family transcriptional regulator [Lachnospiraceae bacterium]